ncbi:DUF2190 family protein [Maridesulfovibrio sp.]|uniref:DUF2190 family protein n=1 Tax=Maridesulfovibrio sp. TaxID=2795000 RepID=UPI0029C9B3CD|nr:DUF2190 family protein [Maridesulfovibrio sp.]
MAQNCICDGKVIIYTNGTAADILSGQSVVIGEIMGVATVDIPVGQSGACAVTRVWALPKVTGVLLQGAKVYWDADGDPKGGEIGSGALTTTATDNTYAGYVYEAAGTDDPTVEIQLNG